MVKSIKGLRASKISKVTKPKKKSLIPKKDRIELGEGNDIPKDTAIPMDSSSLEKKSDKTKLPEGSIKKHRGELMNLEETDPEFFNFLKENDANLLQFGEDESDIDDDDILDDDMSQSTNQNNLKLKKKLKKKKSYDDSSSSDDDDSVNLSRNETIDVTEEYLNKTINAANNGSFPSLKKIISILRSACFPANDDADDELDENSNRNRRPTSKYTVNNPDIYEKIMTNVLEKSYLAFYNQLELNDKKITKEVIEQLGKHSKWKKVELLVLSFFKSVLHTLESMTGNTTQGQVSVFLMTSLEPYIVLLAPMQRLAKATLKIFLRLWSEGPSPNEDSNNVRGHAFLRIRHMSLVLQGTMTEECFRSIYLTYARTCKTFTELTSPAVLLMGQSITELYCTDIEVSYQQAFLYIRQLALHLRTALMKKDAESIREVTSWQFLNCVRVWTKVICTMPTGNALGPLVFPLTQIIFGVMTAAPSFYNLPLKFHLITCLHQLAAYSLHFIPTAPKLLEILESDELITKPTPSTEVAPKLQYLVKLPVDSATKPAVRDVIIQETMTLLRHDSEIYRYHVAYPEYTYLTIKKLKNFAKKSRIARWRDLTRALCSQLEQQSASVKKQRVTLGKSPLQINTFEPLLPPGEGKSSVRLAKLLSGRGLSSISGVTLPSISATSTSNTSEESNKENKPEDNDAKKKKKKTKKSKSTKKDNDMDVEVEDNKVDLDQLVDDVKSFDWSDDDSNKNDDDGHDNEEDNEELSLEGEEDE